MAGNEHPWLDALDRALQSGAQWVDTPTQWVGRKVSNVANDVASTGLGRAVAANNAQIAQKWHNTVQQHSPVVRAGMNFIPSAVSEGANIIGGLGTALEKPAETAVSLGKTAGSGVAYLTDKALNLVGANPLSSQTQRYVEAPARAAGTQMTAPFRDKSGDLSWGATKQSLINNPGGLALDAAMALAPAGEVGKGLGALGERGAKVADWVSQGAQAGSNLEAATAAAANALRAGAGRSKAVGNAAVGASAAVNPVTIAAKPVAAVGKTVAPVFKAFSNNSIYRMGDEANGVRGNFADVANSPINPRDAVQGAATPEGLASANRIMVNPNIRSSVEDVVSQKGLSPQSIAEGEARAHGVSLTRDQLNGTTLSKGSAASDAKDTSAALARSSSSIAPSDPTSLFQNAGNEFINAHRNSLKAAEDAYGDLGTIGGNFDRENFFNALSDNVAGALTRGGDYKSLDEITAAPLSGTKQALAYIDNMSRMETPMDLASINSMRRAINSYAKDAPVEDSNYIGRVRDALMDTTGRMIDAGRNISEGAFTGDADKAAGAIDNANSLWAQHQENFGSRGKFGGVSRILGPDARDILVNGATPTPEQLGNVGSALVDSVANPKLTNLSTDKLDALGNISPTLGNSVASGVHWRLANGLANGASGEDALNALGALKGYYDPSDVSHMASAADLHDLVNQPLKVSLGAGASRVGAIGRHLADTVVGGTLGSATGPLGGAVGAMIGDKFANLQDKSDIAANAAANAAGSAPSLNAPARILNATQQAASTAQNTAPYIPAALAAAHQQGAPTPEELQAQGYVREDVAPPAPTPEELQAQGYVREDAPQPASHAAGGRAGYRAGGTVKKKSVEHLVRALMSKAEKAKRENNKSTEPLLKLHDNTVAKALALAQKSI